MSKETAARTIRGNCHCGRIRLEFSTSLPATSLIPRACDCSFCRKHGAAYLSDPDGQLTIHVRGSADLCRYQQGSNTAQFLLCATCGVFVAVVHDCEGIRYGAVNSGCLEAGTELGSPVVTSPQALSPQAKIARWLQVWIPDVRIVVAGAEQ